MSRSLSRWVWRPRRGAPAALAALLLAAALAGLVAWLNLRGEAPVQPGAPLPAPAAELVQRGGYLARAANCAGCHTAPGGAPLAGGRGVHTPFGTVYAPNITPDARTGLGRWSASEFRRALHHGRSRDGRLLYPAFPYPSFTRITRDDVDALFAWLRAQPPVEQPNRPHALRWPYGTQAALAVWRALYFRAQPFAPEPQRPDAYTRGQYLVQALGHCAACHSSRNALGGIAGNAEFGGGLMPDASWFAPALSHPAAAGVQGWPREEVRRLLGTGTSARGSVAGPMAEVVYASTQHLSPADLDAMALYLGALPQRPLPPADAAPARTELLAQGATLYDQHCAACHGARGQGVPGIYPALAGNRALTLEYPHNLVQMIRHGGFAPATPGHPRPFGMPPFGQLLSDEEVAALASYLRQSWGHAASAVTVPEVRRIR